MRRVSQPFMCEANQAGTLAQIADYELELSE